MLPHVLVIIDAGPKGHADGPNTVADAPACEYPPIKCIIDGLIGLQEILHCGRGRDC